MLDKSEARAWVVLLVMAVLDAKGEGASPSAILNQGLIEAEWERLRIDREYPGGLKVSAPQLYAAFDLLVASGMIDNLKPLAEFAAEYRISIGMMHLLAVLTPDGTPLEKLEARFVANAVTFPGALARLCREGYANKGRMGNEVSYTITDEGLRFRGLMKKLLPLLAMQRDWTLTYQINRDGLASAQGLGEDWTMWPGIPSSVEKA